MRINEVVFITIIVVFITIIIDLLEIFQILSFKTTISLIYVLTNTTFDIYLIKFELKKKFFPYALIRSDR
jgi:hypothetical protein